VLKSAGDSSAKADALLLRGLQRLSMKTLRTMCLGVHRSYLQVIHCINPALLGALLYVSGEDQT
jgi:hypothetical protein